ncbi:redox-sensing transcriptional repressor Rex [Desulfuribacillus stibiiarsenatis]|uniref:Redox-sensing transcriptional repressor Rex n=1 Tax=Desulfuribacillus stibiiarsenatis TaxID=1390249 RepID=A0A1E5L4Z4_9FIRM|nr:redox-sensing transcriptional repressor Rex [Desulfuribacillus stibiiarsenatis]OEH85217.1 redox-sensing transcriptional repressor Rex [Desulfuribacillus stibiiarsenatis]
MSEQKIPQVTAKRLPVYHRYMEKLQASGKQRVSSKDISEALQIDPATIRRDFSYLGELGKKGYGYNVNYLVNFFRDFLKKDQVTNVILVGVGNLGTALLNYNLYKDENSKIVAAVDVDSSKVGSKVNGVPIHHFSDLDKLCKEYAVTVAIVTVPAQVAQSVVDQLVMAGIQGILNFTPVRLLVPKEVRIHYIDLTVELQTLIYLLKNNERFEA